MIVDTSTTEDPSHTIEAMMTTMMTVMLLLLYVWTELVTESIIPLQKSIPVSK